MAGKYDKNILDNYDWKKKGLWEKLEAAANEIDRSVVDNIDE